MNSAKFVMFILLSIYFTSSYSVERFTVTLSADEVADIIDEEEAFRVFEWPCNVNRPSFRFNSTTGELTISYFANDPFVFREREFRIFSLFNTSRLSYFFINPQIYWGSWNTSTLQNEDTLWQTWNEVYQDFYWQLNPDLCTPYNSTN